MRTVLAVLVSFGVSTSGCAAITASRTETLSVTSEPPGADVLLNGAAVARTPANVLLERKHPPVVQVAAKGYRPQECTVRMEAGGGYLAADIILCVLLFPIGCISFIDATGDWNTLTNPYCSVALAPASGTEPPPPPPPGPIPPPPPPPG